jgi:SAM-dependent methyltransferase
MASMPDSMRSFWDSRAEEDAFFFVDSRLPYRHADLDRFWSGGEDDLEQLLEAVGAAIEPTNHVLEIGCGVGRLTRVLARRARYVTALDVSARMLELAQQYNSHLDNVEWVLGNGTTLAGVESASMDACVSHVVFQHIPDPGITLQYVREMGRVLKLGGWAAFQISNDPDVHVPRSVLSRARRAVLAASGRAPRGQNDARWRGSMVELDALRDAAHDGSMDVERMVGEGTQWCCVLARR